MCARVESWGNIQGRYLGRLGCSLSKLKLAAAAVSICRVPLARVNSGLAPAFSSGLVQVVTG
jgi:hypothetical protein